MSLTPKAGALALALLVPGAGFANYPDVPPSHWAHDAVTKVTQSGLMRGRVDGRFHGSKAASRYDVAVALAKSLAEIENTWAAHGQSPEDLVPYIEQINLYVADELDHLKQGQRELRAWIHEIKVQLDAQGGRHGVSSQRASMPAVRTPESFRNASAPQASAEKPKQMAASAEKIRDNYGKLVTIEPATQVASTGKLSGWLSNLLGKNKSPPDYRPVASPVAHDSQIGAAIVKSVEEPMTKSEVDLSHEEVGFMSGERSDEEKQATLFLNSLNSTKKANSLNPDEEIASDSDFVPVDSKPPVEVTPVTPATPIASGKGAVGEFVVQDQVLSLSEKSRSILEEMRKRRE